MLSTIIVPLDTSALAERALLPAAAVARATGATLIPMMVVRDGHIEDHECYLNRAVTDLDVKLGRPFVIRSTDTAESIVNAGEMPDALIVMTSHGRTGVRRGVLGSVAEKVLGSLDRPVLLVGPSSRTDLDVSGEMAGRCMIPVGGDDPSTAIVPSAVGWCRFFELEPWVVTVHDPKGEGAIAARAAGGDLTESAPCARVARSFRQVGMQAEWEVLHSGTPESAIVTSASDAGVSLIAMTAHVRRGVDRLRTGSTTAAVIHDAPCPVLTVHRGAGDRTSDELDIRDVISSPQSKPGSSDQPEPRTHLSSA